ncbi:MAG: PorP/SprF family type IX secretion system membrane protein [Saprospiraceae bacterium]|nr:PorP/SprF family type IX secretion system membrane protein [Saprospiraceae bacterium]
MKITLSLRCIQLLVVFALSAYSLPAQDIHFSQFGNSPLNLSPGLNGVFGGDLRFVGNYRSQWRGVPVPYTTFSGSIENKFYYDKYRYDRYLTGTLLINYDRQGTLRLSSLQIGIPIGITLPVAENNFLSLAVTPAFGQRAFNNNKWTFDAQFVDCLFNPSAPTLESGSLFSTNLQYFDLAAGLNYHWQAARNRSKVDVGAGLHHINRPNHDFWTNSKDVRLATRLAIYGLAVAQLTNNFDLVLQGQFQRQGAYRELLYGAGVRMLLKPDKYDEVALQVGAGFRQRYSDAVVWNIEAFWRTWSLGFSYDLNVSEFDQATQSRGGPEVSLIYRLYKPKVGPSCPVE